MLLVSFSCFEHTGLFAGIGSNYSEGCFNVGIEDVCLAVLLSHLTGASRLAISYKDLRSIPDFEERTILAIKAPQDTELNCDTEVGIDVPGTHWSCILTCLGLAY